MLPEDGNKSGPSWTRMWNAIDASRELVAEFENAATVRRHGGMSPYTHEERKSAILNCREVVRLFAEYLERNP
jgi:hypothetical protein